MIINQFVMAFMKMQIIEARYNHNYFYLNIFRVVKVIGQEVVAGRLDIICRKVCEYVFSLLDFMRSFSGSSLS